MVCLATAHPAKFPSAVEEARTRFPDAKLGDVELPLHMTDLFDREERMVVLPDNLSIVQDYIAEQI
jgi:threonine synthase